MLTQSFSKINSKIPTFFTISVWTKAVKKFAFRRIVAVDGAAERTSKYTRLKREVQNQWKLSRGHPNIVT